MKNFAFVFARGGSKGLPRKNIKILNNKPLIQYSIDIAKKSSLIERVFVSTDDDEIARISEDLGAEIIKRPPELAADSSPEWQSWQHAIDYASGIYGDFDLFVSLPTTSPLRSLQDVDKAIQKIQNKEGDICISVTPASRSPYFNMVQLNKSGHYELLISSDGIKRRQDAPKVYDITTVVYVSTPFFIKKNSSVWDGKVTAVEVAKERSIDIDDIYDFVCAEALLNMDKDYVKK